MERPDARGNHSALGPIAGLSLQVHYCGNVYLIALGGVDYPVGESSH